MVGAYIMAGLWVLLMMGLVPFMARRRGHSAPKASLLLLLVWGFAWVGIRSWLLRPSTRAEVVVPGAQEWLQQLLGGTLLIWTLCFAGLILYLWLKPVADPWAAKIDQIGRHPDS